MKRRSFLAGMVLSCLVLASCQAGAGGSDTQTISADSQAELTLFYWDKNQTKTVEDNIKRFNEEYPNIKVTTNLAGYSDYWKKLRTQAQGDELPDVFWMNGPNIQLYASNGMLEPLDEVTRLGIDWANYPQALVDLYTFEGKHYGIRRTLTRLPYGTTRRSSNRLAWICRRAGGRGRISTTQRKLSPTGVRIKASTDAPCHLPKTNPRITTRSPKLEDFSSKMASRASMIPHLSRDSRC